MLFKKVPAAAGCFQYQYTTEKRPCTAGVCRADRRPLNTGMFITENCEV